MSHLSPNLCANVKPFALLHYVEKLLPLIDFCRNTSKFSERVIQELCKLKKVRLKGDFYSLEFNRKFRDESRLSRLKRTRTGKDITTYALTIFRLFNGSDRKRMNGETVLELHLQDRIKD